MASVTAAFDGWSSLPGHLLVDIAIRTLTASSLTSSVEDFNSFRAVCTNWRAAATKDVFAANYSGPWRIPYLMLAEKEGSCEREFYNPSTGKFCAKLSLPEASGKRCIEARFGWLLTLADSGEVELLDPVSRSQIELPNYKSFPGYPTGIRPSYRFIRRAVLSANPSDFVLVVNTHKNLGFWKNGDENWTRIEQDDKEDGSIEDVAYSEKYKKFYAIGTKGHVWGWDPNGSAAAEWLFGVCAWYTGTRAGFVQGYLMELPSGAYGDMLMVTRNGRFPDLDNGYVYGTTKFKVFTLNVGDVDRGIRQELEIEDGAIFVGHNAAVYVQTSKFPGLVKPNCIYFSDDSTESYFISHLLGEKCNSCMCCGIVSESSDDKEGEGGKGGKQVDNEEGKGKREKLEGEGDGEGKSEKLEGENKN